MREEKRHLLLEDVGYWGFVLIGSIALSFTPWLCTLAVNSTFSQEQRERIERYQEELRKQGISK